MYTVYRTGVLVLLVKNKKSILQSSPNSYCATSTFKILIPITASRQWPPGTFWAIQQSFGKRGYAGLEQKREAGSGSQLSQQPPTVKLPFEKWGERGWPVKRGDRWTEGGAGPELGQQLGSDWCLLPRARPSPAPRPP